MAIRASIFDKVLADAMRRGYGPKMAQSALQWYKKKTMDLGSSVRPATVMKEENRLKSTFQIGKMYYFYYDPKLKKELPYYDTFPLIFPIGPAPGGFYGINLHYISPFHRAVLMNNLYNITNNTKFDKTTKLVLSYKILNSATKYSYFKPCIKHYLADHVRSKFLLIDSVEWNIALFLPTEQFKKKSKEFVWKESKSKF